VLSLFEEGSKAGSRNVVLYENLDYEQSSKQEDYIGKGDVTFII
jgi:hypothetical protein